MARGIGTTAAVLCLVLVAAGCGRSGRKQAAPSTTLPATTTCVGCIDTSPTGAALNLARSSNWLFSIFPAAPGTKACLIPAGGPAPSHLHGTCRTIVRPVPSHEPAFKVTFTERWMSMSGGSCPPPGCPVSMPLHHTWTIVEGEPVITPGARLHIFATRQSGMLAPQFWR